MLPDPNLDNNTATLTQNLLSPRLSGGGAGCSAVPGGAASGFAQLASLFGLLALAARRRRRAA
jgi:MYXO-CTERM domain-containing protein